MYNKVIAVFISMILADIGLGIKLLEAKIEPTIVILLVCIIGSWAGYIFNDLKRGCSAK